VKCLQIAIMCLVVAVEEVAGVQGTVEVKVVVADPEATGLLIELSTGELDLVGL
jgi:hypothetical protein